MSKKEVKENEQVVEAKAEEVAEPKVQAALTIRVLDNGGIELESDEEYRVLSADEVEGLTRQVYEQLRDVRIGSMAVEMFKQRLG
jgi:hypothetical protein